MKKLLSILCCIALILSCCVCNVMAVENSATLIARYSFEDAENFGKDSLGNFNLQQNGEGVTQVDGAYGKAAKFDGTTNLSAGMTDFQNLDDYTIAFYASLQQTGDVWLTTVQNGSKLKIFLNPSSSYVIIQNSNGAWLNYYDMNRMSANVADMHHYAVSVSETDNTITLYIDGVERNKTYNANEISESNNWNVFSIGGISDIGGYHNECIKVTVDEVNVYDGTLTAAQVEELYTNYDAEELPNEPETNSAELIAKYSFEKAGDFGYDSLGNIHLQQNGTGITQVEGAYGKAAKFDGTTNLSAGMTDFQSLNDYTISFFASVQHTGDVWLTTVQNGSKLKIFLNPSSSYVIIQNGDGAWLNYYDMNRMDAKVSDMHHYVVSVSETNNTITLYIDGVERNTTNNANELVDSNNWNVFSIGGVSDVGGYHNECIQVTVDEVNVYDGTLTAVQVEELYNSYSEPFVPETNTPDAFYKFDDENIGKDETGKYDLSYDSSNLFRVPSVVSTGGAVEFVGGGSEGGWQEDLYIENNFTKDYTNFTISCQLKLYELFGNTNLPIVSTGWDDQGGFTFGLNNWAGDYCIFFDGRDTAGNTAYISGTISEEILNVWHSYSLVVSGNGKTVSLYCDSTLIATNTFSNPLQMENTNIDGNNNKVVIGNYWWRSGGYEKLTGEMDNLCFYSKALSIGEISEITGIDEVAIVGDANDDGDIDIRDLVKLKKSIAANEAYLAKYDCTKDFNVNSRDLTVLRQYILGLVFDFSRMEPDLSDIQEMENKMIITTSINQLRDPCILLEDDVYYAYGTGWVCYKNTSGTLSGNWEYVGNVVETPADASGDFWAPEVHKYNGSYYMFTTYMSKTTGKRGCTVLKSDSPVGPFVEISDGPVTPADWHAIDGTLYVDEEGQPWMIFVREWIGNDDGVGRMVAAKMSDDLTKLITEPIELFRADDPKWATNGVTDGCWLYKCENGELLMIWSNWDSEGYCVGVARSDNGKIDGNWTQDDELLYSKSMGLGYDGGHGMIFKSITGQMYLSIHSPNDATDSRKEKPVFIPIKEENGKLVWDVK